MTDKRKKLVAELRDLSKAWPGSHPVGDSLNRAVASMTALSKDNKLLIDANKLLNDKCERLMVENESLVEENGSLMVENERLKEEANETSRLYQIRNGRIEDLQAELSAARAAMSIHSSFKQDCLKALSGENARLKAEVVQLKGAELNPEDMKGIPVLGDVSVGFKEITKLKDELSSKNRVIDLQSEEISKLAEEVERLEERTYGTINEENCTLKEHIHFLENRAGRLGETINARETLIDELLKQLEIAQIPGKIVLCEENAKLKDELAAANDATVVADATILELREGYRRLSVESNDFRNRMIREQTLVSQLAAAVEGLSNQR